MQQEGESDGDTTSSEEEEREEEGGDDDEVDGDVVQVELDDTKTQKDFEEGKKWLVESDRRQVEKGSDTTWFMEWVRKHVPTARYPEWSTGARREEDIVERQRLKTQCLIME